MRVALPHTLGKDEVRRRMHRHADEIGGFFPAGLARVTTGWPRAWRKGPLEAAVKKEAGRLLAP